MQPHIFAHHFGSDKDAGTDFVLKQGFGAPMELPTPVLLATGQGRHGPPPKRLVSAGIMKSGNLGSSDFLKDKQRL